MAYDKKQMVAGDKIIDYTNDFEDRVESGFGGTDTEIEALKQKDIVIEGKIDELTEYKEYMLVPESGFTVDETIIQKKGKIIFISGVIRGDFPPSAYTKAASLPFANLRPKVTVYSGAATVGGRTSIAALYSNGNLEFNHVTEINRGWMGFNISYLVD